MECKENHNHHHHHHESGKNLGKVLCLTFLFMIAEFIGGIYTNSLALTADAGHMFSDVCALALSFFAMWIANKPSSAQKTYGYFRTEILAAFINGLALIVIALIIIYEAYTRLVSPPEVKAPVMIIIAFGGLIVNIIGAVLLHKDSKESLNIKGAFLHILGDLLGSLGAVFAGFMMLLGNFYLADPIISFIIAILILYSSIHLMNEAINVLMEASPADIDVTEIKNEIESLPDIIGVHDLHVWSISSNKTALSVHIVTGLLNNEKILKNITDLLKEKFNIYHSTVQIEPENFDNNDCPLNSH